FGGAHGVDVLDRGGGGFLDQGVHACPHGGDGHGRGEGDAGGDDAEVGLALPGGEDGEVAGAEVAADVAQVVAALGFLGLVDDRGGDELGQAQGVVADDLVVVGAGEAGDADETDADHGRGMVGGGGGWQAGGRPAPTARHRRHR